MRTGSANSAVLCSRKPNHNWANFNMKSDFITDIFPKIHSFYHQSSLVRGTDSIIENNMNLHSTVVCIKVRTASFLRFWKNHPYDATLENIP